jgi:hypothetical protein
MTSILLLFLAEVVNEGLTTSDLEAISNVSIIKVK